MNVNPAKTCVSKDISSSTDLFLELCHFIFAGLGFNLIRSQELVCGMTFLAVGLQI